jgi:hypothetical protein
VARASLGRLRDDTVAEFVAEAAAEANPYPRETLLAAAEQLRTIGNGS